MQKLTCLVVDDEPEAIEILKVYIQKTPFLELLYTTTHSLEAFTFLQQHSVDIVFLDIEMPNMNGVELAKLLQHLNTNIIFTTAYSQYAVDGFELSAVDYLLKPISFERFLRATQKVLQSRQLVAKPTEAKPTFPADDFLLLKTGTRSQLVKLFLKDIVYIESQRNNTLFVTDDKKIETIYSLKEIEEHLPAHHFLRIHKSYIIALDKISHFDNSHVFMLFKTNTKEGVKEVEKPVSIGDSYRGMLQTLMKDQIVDKKGLPEK